jgi:farnesyl-diphosphate farnesyltransferase
MPTLVEMLRASSRTFAIGIERLPGILREAVMVAYLLLRISDYLEDNHQMSPEKKVTLLYLWDRILGDENDVAELVAQIDEPDGSNPDQVVARNAEKVLGGLKALPASIQPLIIRNIRDTTIGMARWVSRGPQVEDESDLDDYMHEVAGRVGYLLTHLFAWYSPYIRIHIQRLMPLAREFGLALQTVNVIRGLHEDYKRGWIFVPKSFCIASNVARENLFQPENLPQAMQVLERLTTKAERHLDSAMRYLKALPPWQHSIRLFCVYPLMFAVRTLALSRRNQQVLFDEVKMTREEVAHIVRETTKWSWSNFWLDRYYRQLSAVAE